MEYNKLTPAEIDGKNITRKQFIKVHKSYIIALAHIKSIME